MSAKENYEFYLYTMVNKQNILDRFMYLVFIISSINIFFLLFKLVHYIRTQKKKNRDFYDMLKYNIKES